MQLVQRQHSARNTRRFPFTADLRADALIKPGCIWIGLDDDFLQVQRTSTVDRLLHQCFANTVANDRIRPSLSQLPEFGQPDSSGRFGSSNHNTIATRNSEYADDDYRTEYVQCNTEVIGLIFFTHNFFLSDIGFY